MRFLLNIAVVLFGAAIFLFAIGAEAERDRNMRILQAAGASLKVGFDPEQIVAIEFDQADIDIRTAAEILVHADIGRLMFRDCRIRAGVLPLLARLPHLRTFEAASTIWDSEAEFEAFLGSVQLERVDLRHTAVTDAQLQSLEKGQLREAILHHGDGLSADSVASLAALSQLRTLNCSGIPLTQTFCREICARRPDLEFSVVPADLVELRPLIDAGVTFELDRQAHVVGMSFESGESSLPPSALEQFGDLRRLSIVESGVGTDLLKTIGSLKELRALSLERSRVSSGGLMHLRDLSHLIALNLDGIATDGGTDVTLPSLASLRFLRAFSDAISDKLLDRLDLQSLEFLSLGPGVTGNGLRKLANVGRLRSIALCGTSIDHGMLDAIASIEQLTDLVVFRCSVEEEHLTAVVKELGLATLHLIQTDVSPEAVDKLHGLAPALRIVHW